MEAQLNRKAMNYKTIILIIMSVLVGQSLQAQQVSEKRTFEKSVAVNKSITVEIYNKYGNVHITPWDKDSASITAEVEAFASNAAKLNKMMDGVSVNITETSYVIRAQTDFKNNFSVLIETFKGLTGEIIPFESSIEVNYYISVPAYINLKIENSYGDVYLEDILGELSLSIANGSFKANYINKASLMDLSFCDATINKINSGNINISYSDLLIKESGDLRMTSRSSRITLNNIAKLDANSRRDKFYIGDIELLQGVTYFTDFFIDKMTNEINLTLKYGSVNADIIDNKFSLINISAEYTDIALSFAAEASFYLDIKRLSTFITLPERNTKLQENMLNDEKKESITFGTVGKGPGDAKVKINAIKGTIKLRQN
jgi:hypothetical protein